MNRNTVSRDSTGSHRGGSRSRSHDTVHVDCDGCAVRGDACGDCVITVLLGAPPGGVDLDADEQAALLALAGSGLVPPLRLVPGVRRAQGKQAPIDWVEFG